MPRNPFVFIFKRRREEEPTSVETIPKGYAVGSSFYTIDSDRQLKDDELFRCYFRSFAVRHCVDAIASRVAYNRWVLVDDKGQVVRDPEVEDFFWKPNFNGDDFYSFVWKLAVDLLIYDKAFIEKVRSESGKLYELYVRDASTFSVKFNEHGILEEVVQAVEGSSVNFKPGEGVIMIVFHPTSKRPLGCPIIESIVGEVVSLLLSIDKVAETFSKDSIPSGILNLGPIGKEAYERAKAEFLAQQKKSRLFVFRGVNNIDWIPFKGGLKDDQILELREAITDIIYRTFGISRAETHGESSSVSYEAQEEALTVRFVEPLMKIIENAFNEQVVKGEFGKDNIYFQFIRPRLKSMRYASATTRALLSSGVLSIGEVREELGLPLLPGEDVRYVVSGGKVFVVTEDGNLKPVAPGRGSLEGDLDSEEAQTGPTENESGQTV